MNTSAPAHVAIYARISEDTTGEGIGVARQVEACRELAASRGWIVVAEETDNDISALTGKHRPGYQRVLDLVRAGRIQFVVVWQTSRLLRNRRERAEAIELFGTQRVGIITVKGQDLDLSHAYGRGMAGLLGEFDTMESEVKSERVAAAAAERARQGRPNGSLGYGWTKIGQGSSATYALNDEEAAIVREITRRLLAGETLLGVTTDLNKRAVPSPEAAMWARLSTEEQERRLATGRRVPTAGWGKTSVKKLALRPANAALRVHHRGKPTETMYDGAWPHIVSRSEWESVRAILTAPERRTNGPARPGARKHLLTWGIGECGICGGRLRVSLKGNAKHGRKAYLYVCEDGCTGRNQEQVDALVGRVVVERLARPDAMELVLGDEGTAREAGERLLHLQRRLDDAADQYADGVIDGRQLERITAKLRPQIEDAEREHARTLRSIDTSTLAELAGPRAAERWGSYAVSQQRAILSALGVRVVIDRVTRRGPGFDPDSVRIMIPNVAENR